MMDPTVLSFTLYLVGMIAISGIAWRMTRTLSDFVLGGRRLGGIVAALSVGASGMSGWLLLGLPGAFYLLGLNQVWIAVGLSIGAYLNWTIVSPRLSGTSRACRMDADGGRSAWEMSECQ